MLKKALRATLAVALALSARAGHAQSETPSAGAVDAGATAAPNATEPPLPVAPPAPASTPSSPASSTAPSPTPAPPVLVAPEPLAEQRPGPRPSWFSRSPLEVSVGTGDQRWRVTIYGFIEMDAINDSTRSYSDSIGSSLVARDETYAGQVGRTQFSIRNTRLGFALGSPTIGGVRPSAVLEADFFGSSSSTASEATTFDSPGFRVRHAYLKLENDVVDVLAGQTYYLFGWQSAFFPCSLEFLGLPNEAFGRTAQVRLQRTFGTDSAGVDVAVAALRPAQRDSSIPDGNAGIKLDINRWKGISTPGNGGTAAFPLSIGVSGTVRRFKANAFTPPPPQSSNSATGWGLSVDALVPVIPARDGDDRGNRLTLTGSFVTGAGIADLVGTGGGATFPTLPNPALSNPPPLYSSDIDNGLVTFDNSGVLHTIDWQTFMVGIQYYLPPTGRVIVSANFTESYSKNMADLYPRGGREIELISRVAKLSRYADANVFWDVTPAIRLGASFQYTTTTYVDGEMPRNLRSMAQALYFF